jgi:hypothetical protein
MTDSAPDKADFPVGCTEGDNPRAAGRLTSTAISLRNYTDALQEYLQDEYPEPQAQGTSDGSVDRFAARFSATHALRSLKRLLQRVGYGRPVDGNEFRNVLNDLHARCVQAGLLPIESAPHVPPAYAQGTEIGNRPWCLPEWCIMKLYEGVTTLVRDASAQSPASSQK